MAFGPALVWNEAIGWKPSCQRFPERTQLQTVRVKDNLLTQKARNTEDTGDAVNTGKTGNTGHNSPRTTMIRQGTKERQGLKY